MNVPQEFPGITLRASTPEGLIYQNDSYGMYLLGMFGATPNNWIELFRTTDGLRVEYQPTILTESRDD